MPFLVTFLASISTLLGFLFIYLKNDNNRVLIASLSFASGVMFYLSLFDLIPESFNIISSYYNSIYSIIICLLFLTIGVIISSYFNNHLYFDSSLYHVGFISMISIIIHNIPEGIITYLTTSYDYKLGISLAISIAFHNIPEGISISIPIYYSTNNKFKAFIFSFISGISELLGAVIAFFFFRNINNYLFIGCLYSIIAGIMIYISVVELLPESIKYKRIFLTIIYFIIGIIIFRFSINLIK